jgi:hypothetical protein
MGEGIEGEFEAEQNADRAAANLASHRKPARRGFAQPIEQAFVLAGVARMLHEGERERSPGALHDTAQHRELAVRVREIRDELKIALARASRALAGPTARTTPLWATGHAAKFAPRVDAFPVELRIVAAACLGFPHDLRLGRHCRSGRRSGDEARMRARARDHEHEGSVPPHRRDGGGARVPRPARLDSWSGADRGAAGPSYALEAWERMPRAGGPALGRCSLHFIRRRTHEPTSSAPIGAELRAGSPLE